jgi:hypothetical protein
MPCGTRDPFHAGGLELHTEALGLIRAEWHGDALPRRECLGSRGLAFRHR